MERVPIVQIQFPIVQYVILKQEPHVVNVIRIISLNRQRSVHYVQVSRSVKHVLKHRIHVRNVIMAIIQVEQDVLHVQQSQDALNVPVMAVNVRNVIQDTIQMELHVLHVQR